MNTKKYNNLNLFNKEGAIFMGAQRTPKNCITGIFGVPYDGTTSFKPGARFGPSSIREVSNGIETFCPQLNMDLESMKYVDLGSLEIPLGAPEPIIKIVEQTTEELINNGLKPLMLGGEHSVTCGAIKACAKTYHDLILIQLDAHADLRMSWQGSEHNHACTMKRCLEVLPSKNLLQVGIRSGSKDEFQEMQNKKRLISQISGQYPNALEKVLETHIGKPLYITIDLDWFDPGVLPGTGTPEPGGFNWQDFAYIIHILKKHKVIGADVVELAPQLDQSGISSILAAKVTRSLLMLLNK